MCEQQAGLWANFWGVSLWANTWCRQEWKTPSNKLAYELISKVWKLGSQRWSCRAICVKNSLSNNKLTYEAISKVWKLSLWSRNQCWSYVKTIKQPTHYWVCKEIFDFLKYLLLNNFLFRTPLLIATSKAHLNVMKYLIKKGADMKAQTNKGE